MTTPSQTTPYYQNALVTICWEESLKSVNVTIKGLVMGHSDQYRAGLEKGLELFQLKGAHHWLGDSHQARTVDLADRQWVEQSLMPRLLKAGLQRAAMVVPEDVRVKMGFKQYMNGLADGKSHLQLQYFSTLEDARAWLASS